MDREKRHPSWWQLWLLLPALGLLAYFEAQLSLSTAGHRIIETGIVLVVFWLAAVWLRSNEGAMLREIGQEVKEASGRQPEASLMLPPDATISISSNGNGHRLPAWYIPAARPESAAAFVEAGPGDQDD